MTAYNQWLMAGDLTHNEMKYLKEAAAVSATKRTPEEEIQHVLDCIQSSHEEKQTLHELFIEHRPDLRLQTEWINEEINVGTSDDYDNYEWYTQLLDEAEMDVDMSAFESNETCHELFANNPWDSRDFEANSEKVSKRSGFHAWAEVTHIGASYATGETDFGKVFIPIHFVHQLGISVGKLLYMCMTFKGFGECRPCNLPWRCSFINMNS